MGNAKGKALGKFKKKLQAEGLNYSLYIVKFLSTYVDIKLEEKINNRPPKAKPLKHCYKINRRIAIATRDELLKGLLEHGLDMEALCIRLKTELIKGISPVRPNRQFKRKEKGRRKFGCTTRRCI